MTRPIRLMTVAPGHFHAALIQKRVVSGVHPRVHVYAPLDDDLLTHLAQIAAFNQRRVEPTAWELDVRAGGSYLDRMLREQPGNTVVLAGRNRPKIDFMLAAVRHGLHVLADKPWVIDPNDFPKLEAVAQEADLRDVIAWDLMTERWEVPVILQRELMRDPDVFGPVRAGSLEEPGLSLESIHYLKKQVTGRPVLRPAWWFDETEAGHALADVGTHLADLAIWLLFPDRAVDYRCDIEVLEAAAWPTPLDREQVEAVTGRTDLDRPLPGERLLYHGNGTASFLLRGVNIRLTTLWDYESVDGSGDSYEIVARGAASTIAIRPENGLPELMVTAADDGGRDRLAQAVARRCEAWQGRFPGVRPEEQGSGIRIAIPAAVRTSHEDHFVEAVREFVNYFHNPRQIPGWVWPNLLAKYFVTTRAVERLRDRR